MDLHALVKHAEPAQIEGARKALRLVSERGFAREKDLLAELDRVVADVADGSDP